MSIDTENSLYWKLYAQINQKLHFHEEAEYGYKQILELGNYELNIWLSRGDLLIKIGEFESAAYNFLQALKFHPEQPEIEYRLAGIYLSLNHNEKGVFYLKNALKHSTEYSFIINELFPEVSKSAIYKTYIEKD